MKKREDFNKLDKRVQRRRLSRYLSFVRAYKNYMRRKMVFGKIVFEFENVYYEDVLLYSKFTPILINQPHTRAVQQKFKEKLKEYAFKWDAPHIAVLLFTALVLFNYLNPVDTLHRLLGMAFKSNPDLNEVLLLDIFTRCEDLSCVGTPVDWSQSHSPVMAEAATRLGLFQLL
mgnify:CR=1 FL=1